MFESPKSERGKNAAIRAVERRRRRKTTSPKPNTVEPGFDRNANFEAVYLDILKSKGVSETTSKLRRRLVLLNITCFALIVWEVTPLLEYINIRQIDESSIETANKYQGQNLSVAHSHTGLTIFFVFYILNYFYSIYCDRPIRRAFINVANEKRAERRKFFEVDPIQNVMSWVVYRRVRWVQSMVRFHANNFFSFSFFAIVFIVGCFGFFSQIPFGFVVPWFLTMLFLLSAGGAAGQFHIKNFAEGINDLQSFIHYLISVLSLFSLSLILIKSNLNSYYSMSVRYILDRFSAFFDLLLSGV